MPNVISPDTTDAMARARDVNAAAVDALMLLSKSDFASCDVALKRVMVLAHEARKSLALVTAGPASVQQSDGFLQEWTV